MKDDDDGADSAAVQPSAAVVAQPQAVQMLDEDEDDSREVTDLSLTAPGCAYQLAIAAILRGHLSTKSDNGMHHVAMRDIIASNDPAAPEAFGYLCGAGVPRSRRGAVCCARSVTP